MAGNHNASDPKGGAVTQLRKSNTDISSPQGVAAPPGISVEHPPRWGIRASLRGHPIHCRGDGVWCYDDTDTPIERDFLRPCAVCGRPAVEHPGGPLSNRPVDYADGCLGIIPGVVSACCGHGDPAAAFVMLGDGSHISGPEASRWLEAHKG